MADKNIIGSVDGPQWVQANLLDQLLKEFFVNYKNIKKFTIKPATNPEKNCNTFMLNIEIELNDSSLRSISFLLKVRHDREQYQETIKDCDIFQIEKYIYDKVVPEFEKLYADVGVNVKFGAKSYNLPSNNTHILLENLSLRGFKKVNRSEGLDVEHTQCVLKKLAQWHAASATFVATKGQFDNKFLYGDSNGYLKSTYESLSKIFLSYSKTYNNCNEFADHMHSATSTMFDELRKIAKPDPNEFNVLNHGDFSSKNVMFQYDAFGKIKETYFVDYQQPQYGTPAQDLFYFILSSTKYEIKLQNFDYFIKFYHDNLIENLKLLNYPKKNPSLSELHAMLYKYGVWGFSAATGIMAVRLLGSNIAAKTDSSLAVKTLMYSNERYRKHAEAVLPWLYNRGAMSF